MSREANISVPEGKPGAAEIVYSWLLLPVYVWQGVRIRRRTHRMIPPQHSGQLTIEGSGEALKILVIGDSSAAGVGVDLIEESFAGHLSRILGRLTRRPVQIRIVGLNSATAAHIRDYAVPFLDVPEFHYVALNIGTNDAKNFHSRRRFYKDFGTLLYALRTRFPGAAIIWSGILDMATVPALPTPLNKILGIRSRLLDHTGRILCRERGAFAPDPEWNPVPLNFSADGFHASSAGYREWAGGVADFIVSLEIEAQSQSPVSSIEEWTSDKAAPYGSRRN